jgi:hypothetical protein
MCTRLVALVLALALLLFTASLAFSENSSNQIVMYRLKDGEIKEIRDNFSTDEKIYAEFTFLPEEQEMGVEFRWINPVDKKVQADFELVKSPIPPKKRTVLFWILLQSKFRDKLFGSRFFGRWRLEIWVNSRRIIEKVFDIGS